MGNRMVKAIDVDNPDMPSSSVNEDEEKTPLLDPCLGSYEDFPSKLKVTCPTCKGKGKLSQGQAESLVALIPVTDKRLKPRKTKLYLGITVMVAAICIFLISFFLFPRSVTIKIVHVEAKTIFMPLDNAPIPYIIIKVTYSARNDNFFDASVKELSADASWNKFILSTNLEAKNFIIPGRKQVQYIFLLREAFIGDELGNSKMCATEWQMKLFEKFVSTATVTYLSRVEEVTHTYYGYTACSNSSSLFSSHQRKSKEMKISHEQL